MLTYLILTTRAVLLEAIICGAMAGFARTFGSRQQRMLIRICGIAGLAFSAFIAYMRNTTSLIDSAILNGWLYGISIASFVLFLIFTIKKPAGSEPGKKNMIPWILLGIILITLLAYALPDVWAYPYHALQSEKTVISTDFLMIIIGMVFGLILAAVAFFAAAKCTSSLKVRGALWLIRLELVVYEMMRLSGLFSVFFQKKIVKSNHLMFSYTVFIKNNTDMMLYIGLFILTAAAVILMLQSIRQREPYRNPAEHRKIRAKWRSIRRWATIAFAVTAMGILITTLFAKLDETDVTLSPVEEYTAMDDENIYVAFDLVNDGHLHRFAYETEKGTQIRFIVIQKPNSSTYGIGLDACDVCGETGYYEKDGQVVCNLCDVVMNISTIGFKGGCNPIVIPYEIENGQIIVPVSGLLEYESEFK